MVFIYITPKRHFPPSYPGYVEIDRLDQKTACRIHVYCTHTYLFELSKWDRGGNERKERKGKKK